MLKFGEIAESSKEKRIPEPADKTAYIGLEHLDTEDLEIHRFGSEVDITGQKLVMKKGDLLFGRRNTYLRRAAIAPHDGLFSAHGMILRPNAKVVDSSFFPFFILSDYFMNAAIRISVGSLSPTVNWSTLKELEFSLPPLAEQKKLAETLWAMERVKRAYKKLLAETDRLIEARFVEMFGDEVGGQELVVCSHRDVDMVKLEEYATISGGYAFKSNAFKKDGVPVIRISNIVDDCVIPDYEVGFDLDFWDKNERFRAITGDVLMAMSGATTGKCGIVRESEKLLVNQRVAIIRVKENKGSAIFIKIALQSRKVQEQIKNMSAGCAQPNISGKQIENLLVPRAPLPLQREFAAFVEQAEKSKASLKESLAALTAAQKALMNEAFKVN